MIYFSSNTLEQNGGSVSFKAPSAQSDGTGSRGFALVISRDTGRAGADDSLDINQDAVVVVTQDNNTLCSVRASVNGRGASLFTPDPAGGICTITNQGPGKVYSVSVEDYNERA